MNREPVLKYVKQLRRTVFTTQDVYAVSGKRKSAIVQGLNHLVGLGAVVKIRRGVWAEVSADPLSPFRIIPYLPSGQRTYLSLLSALHLHGIIGQIPQTISCISLAHTNVFKTAAGTFTIHRIAPAFFFGFDWYMKSGDFLVAEPEKALLDCLYLSGKKGRRFTYFPEMIFPPSFDWHKTHTWARETGDVRLRSHIVKRLEEIQGSAGP